MEIVTNFVKNRKLTNTYMETQNYEYDISPWKLIPFVKNCEWS